MIQSVGFRGVYLLRMQTDQGSALPLAQKQAFLNSWLIQQQKQQRFTFTPFYQIYKVPLRLKHQLYHALVMLDDERGGHASAFSHAMELARKQSPSKKQLRLQVTRIERRFQEQAVRLLCTVTDWFYLIDNESDSPF